MLDEAYRLQGITFIWDVQKAAANENSHGVSFAKACEAFFDPFLRVVDVSRNREERDAVIGMDQTAHLLFVVHVQQEEDRIRIISARKATATERKYYESL